MYDESSAEPKMELSPFELSGRCNSIEARGGE